MHNVQTAIVGVGETTYSRNSNCSTIELLIEASRLAADDAGIKLSEIDGLVLPRRLSELTPYEFEFQTSAKLNFSAYSGMEAGAGVIHSIQLAQQLIQSEQANYVLIYVGANQASQTKKASPRNMHLADPYKRNFEIPMGFFPQPTYFGMVAQRYFQQYGNIEETLGILAVNSRKHASLNENAQMKTQITLDDYFASPYLADPLKLLDCCLVTDGAAAIIVSSTKHAKNLKNEGVNILGIATDGIDGVSPYFFSQNKDPLQTAAVKTAPLAFEQAGLNHDQIDLIQIYDSFTINIILQLEDLGFCEKGEAKELIGDGSYVSLEGSLPLNTHGGLLSQGYMFGMNHVIEAVKQIRKETGARQVKKADTALVSGFGGWYQGTLILGKNA